VVVGGIEDSSYRMHRAAAPDATLHDVASDGVIVNVLSRRDQSMQLVVARHREGPNGSDDRAIRVTEIVGELALCGWLDSWSGSGSRFWPPSLDGWRRPRDGLQPFVVGRLRQA
jgi:hypothetical protein